MSFPPATEMFQFAGFASWTYVFSPGSVRRLGLPHSDIRESTNARFSSRLFAACHVLHRLSVPRHPPNALKRLIQSQPPHTENKAPYAIASFDFYSALHLVTRLAVRSPIPRKAVTTSRLRAREQPPQQGNRPKQPVAFLSTM